MAPSLLTMAEVQRFESLFRRLMAGETGPFVMASGRAQFSQPPIGLRLVKPVRRAVHTRAATTVPRASRKLRTTAAWVGHRVVSFYSNRTYLLIGSEF